MKKRFKLLLFAVLIAVSSSMAAPQYPFPQNKAHPHGTTAKYASTEMIKEHFKKWKQAWYVDKGNEAWILSPEGSGSTVSEGIAYGMMIMVYMSSAQNDYKAEFDKLWACWKNHSVSGGASGMNWRIGDGGGNGSATDADVDAALALVMASKQWNQNSYLEEAKTLINWMATNDINGDNSVKPGNQWNDAFNPSYATLANFELFAKVTNNSKWNSVMTKASSDLASCQNSATGLVPDWCSWGSFQPTKTSAVVAQDEPAGFYDDAARTPWRMAWAYYWYGNTKAKQFNDKIVNWLYNATLTASGINSGYLVNGTASTSPKRQFVSSTFSGGLGLAAASANVPEPYLETVYNVLSSMTSMASPTSTAGGEKYYPATLNILYLLLLTGNMPNFYDMTGFTSFVPDPSLARHVSMPSGTQQNKGDATVSVSGFWNWGAYHDKYVGVGTLMKPDSGSSPLFLHGDGTITAEAIMEIGPEPEWTAEAAAAGTLKYPSAGIAVSFLENEGGVDFTKLNIKKIRIVIKTQGPIRIGLLNKKSVELGSEPGAYILPKEGYQTITYDLTPSGKGFKDLEILDWVNTSTAPEGTSIITAVSGLKFEVKDAKGGFGSISIKSIEFLDGSGNVVNPSLITGVTIPPIKLVPGNQNRLNSAKFQTRVSGTQLHIYDVVSGSDFAVFNMQGKVITKGKMESSAQSVNMPNKGIFMVRVGSESRIISIK